MSDKINNIENNPALVAYKPSNGVTEYQVIIDAGAETIWATEQQIADIFDRDRTVVGRHIRNSFKEGELDKSSVSAKFAHTAEDGKTYQVNHYNLDTIISVGYRVKSPLATEFRKWATSKLKEYLLQGYALNKELLNSKTEKIKELESQIDLLNEAAFQNQKQITKGFLSIISRYSKSFEHWIINNNLHALARGSIYIWTNNQWAKTKIKFPVDNQPIMFEDNGFIVFGDCHGEWGELFTFSIKPRAKPTSPNQLARIQFSKRTESI